MESNHKPEVNAFLRRMQNDQEWPWEEKARDELNEKPQLNEQYLSAFKDKIEKYSRAHPNFRPQLDDGLLMAYLRTSKFNVDLAMKRYKNFNKVRLCRPDKMFPVGKGLKDYMSYYEKPICGPLKQRNPLDGTLVFLYSFRNFNPNEDSIEDLFNAVFAILMEIAVDPSIQTYGVRFLIDFTGMNSSVIRSALFKVYYNKASKLAQLSCPIRIMGVHVLEAPRWIRALVAVVFRPLLPKEHRRHIRFHRRIEKMHQFISPEILPDVFGGSAGPWKGTWMTDAIDERHEEVVKNSHYGFI